MTYKTKEGKNAYMRKWYHERVMKDPKLFKAYALRKERYRSTDGHKKLAKINANKKRRLYEEFLGDIFCLRCGYNKCKRALSFHHKDPSKKLMSVRLPTFAITEGPKRERFVNEMKKCVCLCFNCHMELEAGLWKLDDLLVSVSA